MGQGFDALKQQLRQLHDLHEAGALGSDAYEQSRQQLERRIVELVMNGSVPEATAPVAHAHPRRIARQWVVAGTVFLGAGAAAWAWQQSTQASLPRTESPAGLTLESLASQVSAGSASSGTVSLAPALVKKANPEDTVFVFARATEGSRIPLAAIRRQVKDLPFEFRLDDSMAMSPEATLSSASEVVVTARVSRTGDATAAVGDLYGMSAPAAVGRAGLQVEIASEVGQ